MQLTGVCIVRNDVGSGLASIGLSNDSGRSSVFSRYVGAAASPAGTEIPMQAFEIMAARALSLSLSIHPSLLLHTAAARLSKTLRVCMQQQQLYSPRQR